MIQDVNATNARGPAEGPERTCVGCGKRAPADVLVRLVLADASSAAGGSARVVPDAKGGSFGRGAHVHVSAGCLGQASRRGLSRAFKREVRAEVSALANDIRQAFERRLEGLLSGGVRAGLVVAGADPVVDALREGRAVLVVVAGDAAAAASRGEVQRAVAEGRALVYGDRVRLAEAIGRSGDRTREGVAILAVCDHALATEVRRAWLCAGSAANAGAGTAPGAAVEDSFSSTTTGPALASEGERGAGAVGSSEKSRENAE